MVSVEPPVPAPQPPILTTSATTTTKPIDPLRTIAINGDFLQHRFRHPTVREPRARIIGLPSGCSGRTLGDPGVRDSGPLTRPYGRSIIRAERPLEGKECLYLGRPPLDLLEPLIEPGVLPGP